MKKPKKMPMILDIAALVVVGVNLPFALYGYLLFGEETQGMCGGALTTLYHVVRYILAMTQMVCTHNRTHERNKL